MKMNNYGKIKMMKVSLVKMKVKKKNLKKLNNNNKNNQLKRKNKNHQVNHHQMMNLKKMNNFRNKRKHLQFIQMDQMKMIISTDRKRIINTILVKNKLFDIF